MDLASVIPAQKTRIKWTGTEVHDLVVYLYQRFQSGHGLQNFQEGAAAYLKTRPSSNNRSEEAIVYKFGNVSIF